jgi:DnaJ-class molecular chaperone
MLKLLKNLLENKKYEVHNATEETHKYCPECDGSGRSDVFCDCENCNGTGIVRKTYQEYVQSLPSREN